MEHFYYWKIGQVLLFNNKIYNLLFSLVDNRDVTRRLYPKIVCIWYVNLKIVIVSVTALRVIM